MRTYCVFRRLCPYGLLILSCFQALGATWTTYITFHNDSIAAIGADTMEVSETPYLPGAINNNASYILAGGSQGPLSCDSGGGAGGTFYGRTQHGGVWSSWWSLGTYSSGNTFFDLFYSDTGPPTATNSVQITCFTWTNNSPKVAMVTLVSGDSMSRLYPSDGWAVRAAAPGAVLSGCLTNTGLSPDGYAWCTGTTNQPSLVIFNGRGALGDESTAYYSGSCSQTVTVAPSGTTAVTNAVSGLYSLMQTNNPVAATLTNSLTQADAATIVNAVVAEGALTEQALRDLQQTLTGSAGQNPGQSNLTVTVAGTADGTVATNTSLLVTGSGAQSTLAGVSNSFAASAPALTSAVLGGTNLSARGWLAMGGAGLGTNGFGLGTNGSGLDDGTPSGPGIGLAGQPMPGVSGRGFQTLGTAPADGWGEVWIGSWGGVNQYVDFKSILSGSFMEDGVLWHSPGPTVPIYFPGLRGLVRALILWAAIAFAWKCLAEETQHAVWLVSSVPAMASAQVQVLGTTVIGAGELANATRYAIWVSIVALIPVVSLALVENTLTVIGYSGTVATIAGGGAGVSSPLAVLSSSPVFTNVFYLINELFPLVECLLLAINYAVAFFVLRSSTVASIILGKFLVS